MTIICRCIGSSNSWRGWEWTFRGKRLCDWVEKGAEWLQPIVREMKRELLAGDYLQVDETPVRDDGPGGAGPLRDRLSVGGRPARAGT